MLSFFSQVQLSVPAWPWDSSDKNTGEKKKRILEWVAIPSSRGSSQPRDQTHILCGSIVTGWFFTAEPLVKPTYGHDWWLIPFPALLPSQENEGWDWKIPHFLPWLDLSSDQPSSRSHAGAHLQLAHYSKNILLTQEVIKVSRVLYQDLGSETYIYIFFYYLHL